MTKLLLKFIFLCSLSLSLNGQHYKILVLPSGGATAIISAALMEHIEQETGKPTVELFDEVWCSSAGSMLAGLITSKDHPHTAAQTCEFIEKNFSTFYKSYYAREALNNELGNQSLAQTTIPLRILTAHAQGEEWLPYDFSSDGRGTCSDNNVPAIDAIKASCTVYPYLYRSPVSISTKDGNQQCIDPGSLSCKTCIVEPTPYFLNQLLDRIEKHDTAQIFFVASGYTQALDYYGVKEVLEQKLSLQDFAIYYHEGTFSGKQQKQIEVINIPAIFDEDQLLIDYLKKSSFPTRTVLVGLKLLFDKVVGPENATPNLLAAGAIPLKELKSKAHNVIKHSKNLQATITCLK